MVGSHRGPATTTAGGGDDGTDSGDHDGAASRRQLRRRSATTRVPATASPPTTPRPRSVRTTVIASADAPSSSGRTGTSPVKLYATAAIGGMAKATAEPTAASAVGDGAGDAAPWLGRGHRRDELEGGEDDRRQAQPDDGLHTAGRQAGHDADQWRGEGHDGDGRGVAPAGDDRQHAGGEHADERGAPRQPVAGRTDAAERAVADALLGEGDEDRRGRGGSGERRRRDVPPNRQQPAGDDHRQHADGHGHERSQADDARARWRSPPRRRATAHASAVPARRRRRRRVPRR